MGADIPAISRFKAGFGGEMDFYFIVKKEKGFNVLNHIKTLIKIFLK